MHEYDAMAILRQEVTGPHGLLAQLDGHSELDLTHLERMCAALQELGAMWRGRPCIPREAAYLLALVDVPLAAQRELRSPERAQLLLEISIRLETCWSDALFPPTDRLRDAAEMKEDDLEAVFATDWWNHWIQVSQQGTPIHDDEDALTLLRQHLYRDGLIVALRTNLVGFEWSGVEAARAAMHAALEQLGPRWAAGDCVERDMALTLPFARDAMLNAETAYRSDPAVWARMVDLATDLGDHILQTLSL